MPLVLEGIVSTRADDGGAHLAPMGPWIDDAQRGRPTSLVLLPFASSRTAVHLARDGVGVFHVTDDCLLLARLIAGSEAPVPVRPAVAVEGWVIEDCCRAFEFRVAAADRATPRQQLAATVVHVHEGRPFFGWNRAAAAVVEGAVHVSRLPLLGAAEVGRRLEALRTAIDKTAGERERAAFALLVSAVAAAGYADGSSSPAAGARADRPIP